VSEYSAAPLAIGAPNILRAGDKLHVGVVVAELKPLTLPLGPGRNYSYNLQLGDFATAPGQAAGARPDRHKSAC